MPMFLDRHDSPGVTAEELAEAHRLDTEIQEKYGVHYNTYWFDPDRGTVFCLAEGPSERAVVAVHEEAHGQLPSAVIELDPNAPLNALLGPLRHIRSARRTRSQRCGPSSSLTSADLSP